MLGDALEQLKTLPDGSVHCCVTSPPYYGLRDYGVAGQIGLEETPEMLERLRRSELVVAADRNNPARSKISEQVEVLRPIDRTAARVVKQP
jgi:DNA modification methylase